MNGPVRYHRLPMGMLEAHLKFLSGNRTSAITQSFVNFSALPKGSLLMESRRCLVTGGYPI